MSVTIIFSTILAVWIVAAAIDKFFKIPNHFLRAQRPADLQTTEITPTQPEFVEDEKDTAPTPTSPPSLPADVIYLPPTTPDPTDGKPHPVYIVIAGNPGVSTFYIEFLEQVQQRANGALHCYALGHAYFSAQTDLERYEAFNAAQLDNILQQQQTDPKNVALKKKKDGESSPDRHALYKEHHKSIYYPQFDSQRLANTTSNPTLCDKTFLLSHDDTKDHINVDRAVPHVPLLNLKQQILQKYVLVSKIRAKHPHSEVVLAGHSMGAYCCTEILRNIERLWLLEHYGEIGLFLWDHAEEKGLPAHDVKAVENEEFLINIPENATTAELPEKITRLLFSPDELRLCSVNGAMLLNVEGPDKSSVPQLPQELMNNDQNTKENFDTMNHTAQDEQRVLEDTYQQQMVQHMTHHLPLATRKIHSVHGLMPTIFRIANSPNGHFMLPWFLRRNILAAGVGAITALPGPIRHLLINVAAPFWSQPVANLSVKLFLNEVGIHNCIFMATDEMYNIRSLDLQFVQRNAEKFFIYMSDVDEWAPKYQREYLQNVNKAWEKKGIQKQLTVQVDTQGATHAFVFSHNDVLAEHSVGFLKSKKFL